MRIARLAEENPRTQGPERRAWYRRNSPTHLRAVAALVEEALGARAAGGPSRAVVLGAGACTEAPLERLARAFEQTLLVDVDVPGMARARDELPASLRSRVDLLQADITGGVSDALASDLRAQPWRDLALLGPSAALDAAASCLERCPVPDPPHLPTLIPQGYSLVLSDLVLTQLYSLPLLDVVDILSLYAPDAVDLRESNARYRQAAQTFRRRIALAHLALLASLLAPEGAALLATDRTGYLLPPKSGPHARDPRETLVVLPPDVLAIPGDLSARFQLVGKPRAWEWLVTAPDAANFGRMYEAVGAILRPPPVPDS
ncbi:MAG TPA: hypothetical protein VFQ32_02005 [Ktedonobacterales bacterium]|nr:hypothetical protein [Ktedonobacterales bacterium]